MPENRDDSVVKVTVKIDKKLYQFPLLQGDELFLGNVEDNKIIHQDWNYSGTHYKNWVNIDNKIYLISGYSDDEYSAVNRVVASQIGKILGLNCEEVFLAHYHGKCVNLVFFKPCISLAENQMLEMYELNHLDYLKQNEQKKAFNFIIQNWFFCFRHDRSLKEKFTENFVDTKGNVFISELQKCLFLTPQQMPKNLLVPFEINKFNYTFIKDMLLKINKYDVTEIAFGSISEDFIELHDMWADKFNKTNFFQKKDSFDSNIDNLKKSVEEFGRLYE